MAGDWMKIELELPDKPEVHAISGILNLDPDCVVGKLIRVWQWFDKHTVDGNAHGVSFSLPDRISGVNGFGEAMSFVGWLSQQDKTLVMPKFDRHTSESAKQRALTAKRVSKHKDKANANGNDASVSLALPREEKRREDKTYSDEFQKFWDNYPPCDRKGGRPVAFKVWTKLNLDSKIDLIVEHMAATISTYESKYVKAPAAYLNTQGWDGWEPNSSGTDNPFAGAI
jgi:hypothetical protein